MPFKEIPILDMSLAKDESTKPAFLEELRDVLLNVGFLYIKNTGIDQDLFDKVCEEGIRFFDLPEEEKLKNAQSFLGYSKVLRQPLGQTLVRQKLTRHFSWEWKSPLLTPTGGNNSI
jgi:isopenicillin N synthase-like dioxygenase